jgi:uridine phosphorylase
VNETEELFTADMAVKHFIDQRGITVEDIGVAPTVVISWGRRVITSLAEKTGAQPSQHWLYGQRQPLFLGQVSGRQVSFVRLPIGAPGTVMMMEEMIACGARLFIGLGWAGSLQPKLPVGSLLIPTTCIREEGTSGHYLDPNIIPISDPSLTNLLEKAAWEKGDRVQKGPQWTIDAPYRELRSKVSSYRQQGVLGVDMETSAMYSLGMYRQVRVCNLLVVSDVLGDEWSPSFGTSELREATEKAEQIVLRCISSELPTDTSDGER